MTAISAILITVVGVLFYFITKKRLNQKFVNMVPFAFLFMALCASVSIPIPFFGVTVGGVVDYLARTVLGGLFSLFGGGAIAVSILATVAVCACVVIAVIDIAKDKKIDKPAKVSLMAFPFIAAVAIGPIGAWAQSFAGGATNLAANALASMTGLG